jgi:hypothetical protein
MGEVPMTLRSTLARGALFAATGALVLTTAMAIPVVSSAQPYNESAAEQCEQQQNSRAVAGAVLGGVTGAGVAAGADAGASSADCHGDYQPAPPPGYDGGPNAYDNTPPPGYVPGPQGSCGWARRQITYPDGSQTRDTIKACQDDGGHWILPPGG